MSAESVPGPQPEPEHPMVDPERLQAAKKTLVLCLYTHQKLPIYNLLKNADGHHVIQTELVSRTQAILLDSPQVWLETTLPPSSSEKPLVTKLGYGAMGQGRRMMLTMQDGVVDPGETSEAELRDNAALLRLFLDGA